MTSPFTGTIASRFNDDGVTSLYCGIIEAINAKTGANWRTQLKARPDKKSSSRTIIIPPERSGYLAEIAHTIRRYHAWGEDQERLAREIWQLDAAAKALRDDGFAEESEPLQAIRHLQQKVERLLDPRALRLLEDWEDHKLAYTAR